MNHARILLAALLLFVPAQALARGKERRDDRATADRDSCGAAVKDPQRLAEAGLRIYKEAANLDEAKLREKEYERALRCYQAALEQSQGAAVKLHHPLGLVFEKLERYVEAVDSFRRFLSEVPEAQRNVGVTKQITDKLAALKQHVAELAIDTVPGLPVRVDEKSVGKAPLGRLIVVTPGSHSVTVGDPTVGTLGTSISVAAAEIHRVDLTAWKPRQTEPAPQSQATMTVEGKEQIPGSLSAAKPEPAFLTVRSNRSGADVKVDGRTVGRTPLANLAIPPGAHEVLARDGGQRASATITLLPNEQRSLMLSFPVKPWVWALVGIGAAAVIGTAVGVGVYFGTAVGKPDGTVSF